MNPKDPLSSKELSFRQAETFGSPTLAARNSYNNPRGIQVITDGAAGLDVATARMLRDWLNSVLPADETNCNHPASTGVRAWKCDICGTLRESPELGPIALAQRDAEIARLLAIVRESHSNSDGYGLCECSDCAPRAALKAFVQLCAPHGKDWLTCPECAKAAGIGGEKS